MNEPKLQDKNDLPNVNDSFITNIQNPEWQSGDWAYFWNANGMLQKVKRPDGKEVSFEYDALGRRISKIGNKKITRYIWDGNVLLHEWTYDVEDEPKSFVSDEGNVVVDKERIENVVTWVYERGSFVPCTKIVNGESYAIVSDYIGRPIQSFDQEGKIVWSTDYDIFGNIKNLKGEQNFIPFRQLGQYEDVEIKGLHYNRFRYYDSENGNYISKDPIGIKGGFSLYSYVGDSNIFFDLFGWEQERGPDGKFSPKNPGETAPGSDAVNKIKQQYDGNPKYEVLGEEISFKDQKTGQIRRYDLVVKDVETGKITGVEVKATETASYGQPQRTFDKKLNSGKHKITPTGQKAKDAGIRKIDDTKLIRCK